MGFCMVLFIGFFSFGISGKCGCCSFGWIGVWWFVFYFIVFWRVVWYVGIGVFWERSGIFRRFIL